MKPIVICGPTASGKTDLALEIARQTGGVIVSADSRQVYKHLTVGTAKPKGIYQNGLYTVESVPYLLVDFLDVTDTFNAGAFCVRAQQIKKQFAGRTLIFAGGTGLYLHSYFVGMDDLPATPPHVRAQVSAWLMQYGKEGLHQLLAQKDPLSARQIPPGNVQRTQRALELCLVTGQPASTLKSGQFFKLPDEQDAHFVYLVWDKDALHARIQTRTQEMFDGMCAEAQKLLAQGYTAKTPALKTLGYPQALAYLAGTLTRTQAIDEIALKTRQYAKRQRTWFNRYTQAQRLELTPQNFDIKKCTQTVLACVHR